MATTNGRVIEEALSLPADVRISFFLRASTFQSMRKSIAFGQRKRNVACPKLRKAKLSLSPVKKFLPKFEQSTGDEILFPRACRNRI